MFLCGHPPAFRLQRTKFGLNCKLSGRAGRRRLNEKQAAEALAIARQVTQPTRSDRGSQKRHNRVQMCTKADMQTDVGVKMQMHSPSQHLGCQTSNVEVFEVLC